MPSHVSNRGAGGPRRPQPRAMLLENETPREKPKVAHKTQFVVRSPNTRRRPEPALPAILPQPALPTQIEFPGSTKHREHREQAPGHPLNGHRRPATLAASTWGNCIYVPPPLRYSFGRRMASNGTAKAARRNVGAPPPSSPGKSLPYAPAAGDCKLRAPNLAEDLLRGIPPRT
jgi:hypothetical protein